MFSVTLVAHEHVAIAGIYSRECPICQEFVQVDVKVLGILHRCPHYDGVDKQFEAVSFKFIQRAALAKAVSA